MTIATHEVVKFPKAKKIVAKKVTINPRVSSTVRKTERLTFIAANAVTTVSLALTALSLTHLAKGITIVTHAPTWEACAMAIGIDLGFVAVEFAQMVAPTKLAEDIKPYAKPTIIGTMIGSAILNAFAFGVQAEGWMVIPAVAIGLAIPAMIYNMTKISAKLYGVQV